MIRAQQIPEELGRYALLGIALLYLVGLVALPLAIVFVAQHCWRARRLAAAQAG